MRGRRLAVPLVLGVVLQIRRTLSASRSISVWPEIMIPSRRANASASGVKPALLCIRVQPFTLQVCAVTPIPARIVWH